MPEENYLSDAECRELIALIRSGDQKAKDKLILEHTNLVWAVVRRYTGDHGLEEDELFSIGMLGLMRAIEKFDPEKNTKFSSYSYIWVRARIAREVKKERQHRRTTILGSSMDAYKDQLFGETDYMAEQEDLSVSQEFEEIPESLYLDFLKDNFENLKDKVSLSYREQILLDAILNDDVESARPELGNKIAMYSSTLVTKFQDALNPPLCRNCGDPIYKRKANAYFCGTPCRDQYADEHGSIHSHSEDTCARGHPRNEENTRVRKDGGRYCVACDRFIYARTRKNSLTGLLPRKKPDKKENRK